MPASHRTCRLRRTPRSSAASTLPVPRSLAIHCARSPARSSRPRFQRVSSTISPWSIGPDAARDQTSTARSAAIPRRSSIGSACGHASGKSRSWEPRAAIGARSGRPIGCWKRPRRSGNAGSRGSARHGPCRRDRRHHSFRARLAAVRAAGGRPALPIKATPQGAHHWDHTCYATTLEAVGWPVPSPGALGICGCPSSHSSHGSHQLAPVRIVGEAHGLMQAPGTSTACPGNDIRGRDDGGRTRVVTSWRGAMRNSDGKTSSRCRSPDATRKARPINALDRTARQRDPKINAANR